MEGAVFYRQIGYCKKYGFESLEFHDEPHYENLTELQSILSKLELPVNGMNVRMGETFGCAALSEYNEKYLNDIDDAVEIATALNIPAIQTIILMLLGQ